jgi:hypothetical protein
MPPRSETEVRDLMGKCAEEIRSLWKTPKPVEEGWIELPAEYVAELDRRMSELRSELERHSLELPEAPLLRRS